MAQGDHTEVAVPELPQCDFCKENGWNTPAHFDGKTVFGPWANMCDSHFRSYGTGLGLGIGQRLIVKESE